jgi:mannosylglycerate hydrolase
VSTLPSHATLVSHTHWDRAWYCTFQEYRVRLVRLVDRLLKLLNDSPDFRVFMLDGQMCVLEDYLEIRPERASELQHHCQTGRIQVGPWYVLADEFLVSPEALIRNLMVGQRMGEPYGGVMKIGYVPDGFGHIAQLPQILRGFGIDNAFFWRGVGAEGDRLGTEFEWYAPDKSCVTAILMPWGYHNATNLGYAIHWGDVSQMAFDWELAQQTLERAIENLRPMANTGALLLMNGIDHAEAEPRIPEIIRRANARLAPETVIHQGTLADHLAQVHASGAELPRFEGEFRWGRYSEILQGVYSSRIHLKQQNHAGEILLERYMEPLTALAWLSGADVPEGTPALAWRAWHWLLLNHPHDDMYGSGIDAVHEEMAFRFSQSRQIADVLVRDSLRQLARQVDYTGQDGTPLLVYNPLGWARSEVVEARIEFEFDDPKAGNFQVVTEAGETVPHQVLDDEERFWMEVLKPNRKRCVRVLFPAQVPAMGYATYYAQPKTSHTPAALDLKVSERGAENRFVVFSIEDDGGLTVTDKLTGHTYTGLHHFYDVEDAGDEYTYCPLPEHSQTIGTVGEKATVTCTETGPCRAAFRVEWTLDIPKGLTEDRQRRSRETIALTVVSDVRLYADQPGVYITTFLDNQAHDHKLTVNFPTGLRVAQALVDESFMVAARDLKLPLSEGWVEDPTPLMHQRTFTDLSDGAHGLAVLNRGLPSVEVTEDGTVALTLLRSVGWLSRDDLWVRRVAAGPLVPTPGGQCIGSYCYEYAILPHAGDWQQVYQVAYNYNAPLLARRADTHPGLVLREMNITRDNPALVTPIPWPRGGPLPPRLSVIQVEPPALVLSAVRRSERDSLIVRCYNITRQPVEGMISCGLPVAEAHRVNLAEERQTPLTLVEGMQVAIQVRGGEVISVEFVPAWVGK